MVKSRFLRLVTLGWVCLICLVAGAAASGAARIHYSTLFNPNTVTTISGEVVRVVQVPSGNGLDVCVQGVLKTSQGQVTAVLAPKSFMDRQKLTVAPQDRLTVTGSTVSIMGKPFIVATEVKGDRTMKLREAGGRPLWAVGEDWHVH
jgi:hypothetical protein